MNLLAGVVFVVAFGVVVDVAVVAFVVVVVQTGVPCLTFAWPTWKSCCGWSGGLKGAGRHLRRLIREI